MFQRFVVSSCQTLRAAKLFVGESSVKTKNSTVKVKNAVVKTLIQVDNQLTFPIVAVGTTIGGVGSLVFLYVFVYKSPKQRLQMQIQHMKDEAKKAERYWPKNKGAPEMATLIHNAEVEDAKLSREMSVNSLSAVNPVATKQQPPVVTLPKPVLGKEEDVSLTAEEEDAVQQLVNHLRLHVSQIERAIGI